MDNQKIIIILLCIIIAMMLVCIGMMTSWGKEKSVIEFSDQEICAEESLSLYLKDTGNNPIVNETVKVKLKSIDDGKISDVEIATDSNGEVKYRLEDTGHYDVELSFNGNSKYSSSSVKGSVNVSEAKTTSVSQQQTSTATHSSKYSSDGSIYPEYGPEVDSQGITREYAIAHNMHYIEMKLDDGQTVGGYTAYDPAAGSYHT